MPNKIANLSLEFIRYTIIREGLIKIITAAAWLTMIILVAAISAIFTSTGAAPLQPVPTSTLRLVPLALARFQSATPAQLGGVQFNQAAPVFFLPFLRNDSLPPPTSTNTPDPLPEPITPSLTADPMPVESPTNSATASNTPPATSTNTSTATATQTPTNTPTPSDTPTPTDTPTNTPTDTPTPTATSIPSDAGYALQFDGSNDFVELHETEYMLGDGWEDTKTIEVWVKPLGTAAVCDYEDVANCDPIIGDRERWFGITRGIRLGLDRIWIWNYDGSFDIIGVTYTPGQWVHITFMHDNGVLHAYKNGVEAGNTLSGTTQQPANGALPILHIGGIVNNDTQYWTFEGVIDEVRFWNIARSPGQVLQDMNHPLVGDETGLKAYYQMSDGTGDILTDNSQFTWDGHLYDGARGLPPDGSPPQWVISDAFGTSP